MRSRGIVVTLAVILVLIFTVVNWAPLAVNLPINLIFFTVSVPLGLLLVGFILIFSFVFLLLSLLRRAGQLRQLTSLETQLERERALVAKKRLSELEALEGRLGERFSALEQRLRETETGVRGVLGEQVSRLEQSERAQAERLEEHVLNIRNELTTDLAQIETSIRRSLPPASENTPRNTPKTTSKNNRG